MVHAAQRRRPVAAFAAMQSRQIAGAGEHSITRVSAYAVPATSTKGEGYSVLQIETQSGVTGYGECSPISASDVKSLSSIIGGKSAFAYEPLSEMAPHSTRGGVNMALLDIAGKIIKAPVYRVLGGPTRTKARAVARLRGSTDAEIISAAKNHATSGVRAFLVPIEPPPARNQGSLFIKTNLDRLDALRAAVPKADFAIAGASQLTPSDAASLASAAEKDRPLWFDQPCDITNLDALRKVCDETVVPVAFGRGIGNPGIFQDLLRGGLIDLVRPDLLVYGISGLCRIAAMAETYYVAVAPLHDAGPIATAAALQAAASMPNFFALEVPEGGIGTLKIKDGFFELPKEPGLGINVDRSKFERSRIA